MSVITLDKCSVNSIIACEELACQLILAHNRGIRQWARLCDKM